MKNLLYILPLVIAFAFTSCGTPDKKAELEKLKKQQKKCKVLQLIIWIKKDKFKLYITKMIMSLL